MYTFLAIIHFLANVINRELGKYTKIVETIQSDPGKDSSLQDNRPQALKHGHIRDG